MIFVPGM